MNLYSLSVFVHVLTAILGLGPLTALAVASSTPAPSLPVAWFGRLLMIVGLSLGAMLVTGVLIVAQTHGALGKTGWVRGSVALFLVLGALQGMIRRRLKRASDAAAAAAEFRRARPLLWAMCAVVAAITYLMEAKPW